MEERKILPNGEEVVSFFIIQVKRTDYVKFVFRSEREGMSVVSVIKHDSKLPEWEELRTIRYLW